MLTVTGERVGIEQEFIPFAAPIRVFRVEDTLHDQADMEIVAIKDGRGRWVRPTRNAVGERNEVVLVDDAIATKLSLAKAYIDMGDPDGSRHLLDEVIAGGNELQVAEARELRAKS